MGEFIHLVCAFSLAVVFSASLSNVGYQLLYFGFNLLSRLYNYYHMWVCTISYVFAMGLMIEFCYTFYIYCYILIIRIDL